MEGFAVALAAIAAVSITVTKVVDLIRNVVDKDDSVSSWVWNVTAFVVGVAACWGWGIDLVAALVALVPALAEKSIGEPWSLILSGLIAGGFAGFWHEALDALSGSAARSHAQAGDVVDIDVDTN